MKLSLYLLMFFSVFNLNAQKNNNLNQKTTTQYSYINVTPNKDLNGWAYYQPYDKSGAVYYSVSRTTNTLNDGFYYYYVYLYSATVFPNGKAASAYCINPEVYADNIKVVSTEWFLIPPNQSTYYCYIYSKNPYHNITIKISNISPY